MRDDKRSTDMTTLTDPNAVGASRASGGDAMVPPAEGAPDLARAHFPELLLIDAVLEDALRCVQRLSRGVTHRQFEEALEWFDSDRYDSPFAFVNVCDVLDLDPAAVRSSLRIVDTRVHAVSNRGHAL